MQLNIEAPGGEVFPYESRGDLIEGDFSISESLSNDGEIELSDVNLALPELFGLSGLDGYEALPDAGRKGYRAELRGGGRVATDGLVYLDHIDFDDPTGHFGMTLVSGAAQELWRRLGLLDVQLMGQAGQDALDSILLTMLLQDPIYVTEEELRPAENSGYELASVVRACLAEVDATQEGGVSATVPECWPLRVSYVDSDGAGRVLSRPAKVYMKASLSDIPLRHREEGRLYDLPDWTAEKLVSQVKDLTGWRLRATFDGFPSRLVEATMLPDRWPPGLDASALPDVDEKRLEADHGVRRRRPDAEDFALKLAGEIGQASMVQSPPRVDDAAYPPYMAVPPAWATYAPETWKTRPIGDGPSPGSEREDPREPDNDSVRDVLFRAAPIGYDPTGFEVVERQPDAAGHPDVTERTLYGPPVIPSSSVAPYLFSAVDVSTSGDTPSWRGVHYRQALVDDGAGSQAAQGIPYNAAWARPAYEGQRLSRSLSYERDGKYDLRSLDLRLAEPSRGVLAKGRAWMLVDLEHFPKTEGAKMLLRSPLADDYPRAALPPNGGLVTNLEITEGEEREYTGPDGPVYSRHYLAVRWEPPPSKEARALYYEVEYEIERPDGSTGWRAEGVRYGTTHYKAYNESGVPAGTYRFRVRPVDADGTPGEWSEVEYTKE